MIPDGPGSGAPATGQSSAWFATTQWNIVLAAAAAPSDTAAKALEELCRTYWRPTYAYVRCRGYLAQDAEDLIQSFFAQLIERRSLAAADPERGRFRSFLLVCLSHFLANAEDARRAVKRGGRVRIVPLGGAEMEARFDGTPQDGLSPEKVFDRHWALALLEVVLGRLRSEQEASGHAAGFELLKPFLEGNRADTRYAEVAARLAISESGARMMALRLRRRYRALIQEEIVRTLADPTLADDELDSLLAALRGGPWV